MDKPIFYIIVLVFLFYYSGCEKQTTSFNSVNITLTYEYIGVTDVELLLSTDLEELPDQYQLSRNGETVVSGELTDSHTTLWDTTLQPARTYTYQVKLLQQNVTRLQSNELTLTTMDTTSHDFQWEIIEIPSPFGSGVLRDVAIINENDIWAVGEIYADSAQPWLPYNAVHWDGQQWELKRIPTNSVVGIGYYPINTVYTFGPDNVWMFSDVGSYCHWDGNNWQTEFVSERQGGINKIWGCSSTDMYFVGTNGNITHYNGSSWQKLESGTDLPIQDIWGAKGPISGEEVILCVASRLDQNNGRELLKISDQTVEKLQVDGLSWSLKTVWFVPDLIYYVGGDGLYPSRNLNKPWRRDNSFPQLYKHSVRGQAVNDVVVAGSHGLLSHYNGVNWKHFSGGNLPSSSAAYRGVSIEGNILAVVGYHNLRNGLVVVGKRI